MENPSRTEWKLKNNLILIGNFNSRAGREAEKWEEVCAFVDDTSYALEKGIYYTLYKRFLDHRKVNIWTKMSGYKSIPVLLYWVGGELGNNRKQRAKEREKQRNFNILGTRGQDYAYTCIHFLIIKYVNRKAIH